MRQPVARMFQIVKLFVTFTCVTKNIELVCAFDCPKIHLLMSLGRPFWRTLSRALLGQCVCVHFCHHEFHSLAYVDFFCEKQNLIFLLYHKSLCLRLRNCVWFDAFFAGWVLNYVNREQDSVQVCTVAKKDFLTFLFGAHLWNLTVVGSAFLFVDIVAQGICQNWSDSPIPLNRNHF